ncbi:MAG: hypothetical protein OCC45_10540 [Desulfotalea sp.]
MLTIKFTEDSRSRLKLGQQLDVLAMGPRNRRKLVREILKETRKDLRQNIRQQKTVDGSAMKGRSGKNKKRMFRNMGKGMAVKLKNDHSGVLTWKNAGQARTAYRHHHGVDEKFTASRAEKKYGKPDYQAKATKQQAKALNENGYRARVARKRGKGGAVLKKVSQKWIMEHMTIGKAGLILRMLRTGKRKGKQNWKIKTPARPILGATKADADKFLTALAGDALRNIKRV